MNVNVGIGTSSSSKAKSRRDSTQVAKEFVSTSLQISSSEFRKNLEHDQAALSAKMEKLDSAKAIRARYL